MVFREYSAGLKKISTVIHNREEKCGNNEKVVSYAKGKSSKYIPPPMRNKGKQPTNIESKEEEKCWKCGDIYFTRHKCALYTRNIIASNNKKTQKDEADADKDKLEEGYVENQEGNHSNSKSGWVYEEKEGN